MKLITPIALALALTATSATAGMHAPAAGNGKGDGKGRESIAFEVSKSKRTPGATASDKSNKFGGAAGLADAIKKGQPGGFVKAED